MNTISRATFAVDWCHPGAQEPYEWRYTHPANKSVASVRYRDRPRWIFQGLFRVLAVAVRGGN